MVGAIDRRGHRGRRGPLDTLTTLDLSANSIGVEGAKAIAQTLTALNTLNLDFNSIGDEGAKAIAQTLTALNTLNLYNNGIGDDGAKAIAQTLTALNTLNLYNNGIGDEGAKAIAQTLTALNTLNLGNNSIGDEGAKAIAQTLTALNTLDLSRNSIGVEGAKAIAQTLTELNTLNLGNNSIGDEGAKAIAQTLTELNTLYLDNNGIGVEGAKAIAQTLTELNTLYLDNNGIGVEGAQAIAQSLAALNTLHLPGNGIGDEGARAIAQSLAALNTLHLPGNGIGDEGARAIAQTLTALNTLDLGNNSIGDEGLSALLDCFASRSNQTPMRELSLRGNAPQNLPIPTETLEGYDTDALLAAWRRARQAEKQGELAPLNEAKVLVLGDEAVGKTSLVRYLVHDEPRDTGHTKTEGIDQHCVATDGWWPEGTPAPDDHDALTRPTLNIWDFGGQEILFGTHQFFLTSRSVYLLVLTSRREDQERRYGLVTDWLRTIVRRGGDSPIIVVANKHEPPNQELYLDEDALRAEFPMIKAFVRTSCNEDARSRESVRALRETIVQTVAEQKHVREPLTLAWKRVKDEVSQAAEKRSVLDRSMFTQICVSPDANENERENDPDEQRRLLHLLDDLGVVVIARDQAEGDRGLGDELHLLDPNWLTKAIYKMLTNRQIAAEQQAEFSLADMRDILDPQTHPEKWHPFILSRMLSQEIGLCYRIEDREDERYLMPEALTNARPAIRAWDGEMLRFRYKYPELPVSLVPRLIVRAHRRLTDPPVKWRNGVMLQVEECEVLIEANLAERKIDLSVKGPASRRAMALRLAIDDLESVHEVFKLHNAKALIPMPDQPEVDLEYDFVRQVLEPLGHDYDYPVPGAARCYLVGELIGGLPALPTRPDRLASRSPRQTPVPESPAAVPKSHDPGWGRTLRSLLILAASVGAIYLISIPIRSILETNPDASGVAVVTLIIVGFITVLIFLALSLGWISGKQFTKLVRDAIARVRDRGKGDSQ